MSSLYDLAPSDLPLWCSVSDLLWRAFFNAVDDREVSLWKELWLLAPFKGPLLRKVSSLTNSPLIGILMIKFVPLLSSETA